MKCPKQMRRCLAHPESLLRQRIAWRVVFRLDGARVDASLVQRLADLCRNRHEIVLARRHDVHRRNNLVLRQLPHVELMHGQNSVYRQNRIPYFLQRNGRRDTLQQDEGGTADCPKILSKRPADEGLSKLRTERQSRREDDDRNNQTDHRVEVELPAPVREPDNEARRDNPDIAQSITEDVQN